VIVPGLALRDFNRLDQVLQGLIQAQVVELCALLESLDREVVRIAMVLVGKHASTGQAHIAPPSSVAGSPDDRVEFGFVMDAAPWTTHTKR